MVNSIALRDIDEQLYGGKFSRYREDENIMNKYTRRDLLRDALVVGICAGISGALPSPLLGAGEGKYNVLFIAVDDLRPTLGCYGAPIIKTPNIDALAKRGTVFNNAYCQQALCSPSRSSLLTGRRPDTTKIYNLTTHFRKFLPDVVTLPQFFMQHGYHTLGLSKIYHPGLDDPQSWSVPHWSPKGPIYLKPESLAARKKREQELKAAGLDSKERIVERDPKTGMPLKIARPATKLKGPSWEDPDVPDNAFPDGMTADKAIQVLRDCKDKKFFLAVGFHKPHLPFVAPKKYYDMYSPNEIKLAANPFPPKDCPEIALTNYAELRAYTDIPSVGPLDKKKARDLIHGYYAATSYTDAQIGRIINELTRLGLREKTIIVLWGDHGWHLGEQGLWCKHTDFEVATRAPLIFSVPGQKTGAKTNALVEFVDIYPTLCDVAGLPKPEGVEGISLVPVLERPDRPWKKAAFSQHPHGKAMGYTMRTDRYRYTEWIEPGKAPVGVELYDYKTDPEGNVNIAVKPENKKLVDSLSKKLHSGWKAAIPERK